MITRKRAAERAGCHLETVRYYERIGLMPEPVRSAAGYRFYADADIRRLRFIVRARHLGFSTDEVRDLLSLVDKEHGTCADVNALATRHLHNLEKRIADLERVARVLHVLTARCTDDAAPIPDCPVVDALLEDAATALD